MFTSREFTNVISEPQRALLISDDGAVAEIRQADELRAVRMLVAAGLMPEAPLLRQTA